MNDRDELRMTTSLVLRVCAKDGSSHNGFKWPLTVGAEVVAPDWNKHPECGNGLHGWLFGQGDHSCAQYCQHEGAQWLVVEVDSDSIIELGGKVKFPRGVVRFAGDKKSATDFLWENEPRSREVVVIGAQRADLRDKAVVQVGALGTATAGYRGTATAGALGTATAGDCGTVTAGDCGTATAGDRGTATAGEGGTATAGALGPATAGYRGTATAGEGGVISIEYYDGNRYRRLIGAIGENGLKPNTPYRVDDGKFVEAA